MAEFFTGGEATGFLGLFNTFSGDAIKQLSVFRARHYALYFSLDYLPIVDRGYSCSRQTQQGR